MLRVRVFCEDAGHESVVVTLVRRVVDEAGVPAEVRVISARGGRGRALSELGRYSRSVTLGEVVRPDLLVVGIDANCRSRASAMKLVSGKVADLGIRVVCAIADPHVERWLLLDQVAFKEVLGRACELPDRKCNKDRYKQRLADAVVAAGRRPTFGGLEYAEQIALVMTPEELPGKRGATDLRAFWGDLRAALAELRHQSYPAERPGARESDITD